MSHLRGQAEAEATRLLRERVTRLRSTLEEALRTLGEPLALSPAPEIWDLSGPDRPLGAVRDALESLASHRTQRDSLAAILKGAVAFYPRSALFVIKGTTLVGWSGAGFSGHGDPGDERLRNIALPMTGDHLLASALYARSLVLAGPEGPGPALRSALGPIEARESAAVPILVHDRPVAVLYGDTGGTKQPGQKLGLEILARVGGLALESLATSARAPRAGRGAEMTVAQPPPPPDAGRAAPTPPEAAEMEALLGEPDGLPPTQSDGLGAPLGESARRARDDARRFASLLVSEILLYNEDAVIQGRKNRDLRQRLAREIDRSRQAYAERISRAHPGARDYLEDELVRVLAEGDQTLLGS